MERAYVTLYLMVIVIFALSVTVWDIDSQNMHDLNRNLLNGPMSNVNMPVEKPYVFLYSLLIGMFALSVTICQITYEHSMHLN